MVYLVATTYGLEEAPARDLAVALEYFHTASLIFDDLPCMDDATERRGVSCVHFEFGEAEAILAALALINRAYALSCERFQPHQENVRRAHRHILSSASA